MTDSIALVVVSYGRQALIETSAGELLPAISRGRKLQAVCGDRVDWSQQDDGTTVIESVHERGSVLLRHDPRKGQRILAANVDRLLVVLAPQPQPDFELLDCYLIAAESLGIQASLVVNKIDLLDSQDGIESELSCYTEIGYNVHHTQAKLGTGVEGLSQELEGKCGVLVGQSGVGKSSLINALIPDHAPRTQALSEAAGSGRHTTTATRLYHLPEHKGQIVDSPGVRDFRLWDMNAEALMQGFIEFRSQLGQCRFHNCLHVHEPDCAIRSAVAGGRIKQRRYKSYCTLLEQLGLSR